MLVAREQGEENGMSDDGYRWKERGARIREARKQAGLTQKRLAELVGVGAHTVWCWEAGRMRPNQENLSAIAQHCATTPAALEGLDVLHAELFREAELAFREALVGLPAEDIESIRNFVPVRELGTAQATPGRTLSGRGRGPATPPACRPPGAAPPSETRR